MSLPVNLDMSEPVFALVVRDLALSNPAIRVWSISHNVDALRHLAATKGCASSDPANWDVVTRGSQPELFTMDFLRTEYRIVRVGLAM